MEWLTYENVCRILAYSAFFCLVGLGALWYASLFYRGICFLIRWIRKWARRYRK